jgi:hypothetical protein
MAWKLSVGNLIARAPATPAVGGGGSMLAEYPMSDLGNGHPDDPVRWTWSGGGTYSATFDLNLLAQSSDRTDAPSGWADLTNTLAGTPGLPPNPPTWGTYEGRANSLKVYRPSFQDIAVMPGETINVKGGIFRPAASDATGVRVVVIDLGTGKKWDGTAGEWNDDADPLALQTIDDTWLDFDEDIENTGTERTTYRVIVTPDGGAGAAYYVYVSTPAAVAEQDFVAIVGHNIPAGATVTWADGVTTTTFSPVATPTAWETFTASAKRT